MWGTTPCCSAHAPRRWSRSFLEAHTVHHALTVRPETLGQAGTMFSARQVRIEQVYDREGGFFPGRELYCFDPSGNRLEWCDPAWKAGMPQPTFEALVRS